MRHTSCFIFFFLLLLLVKAQNINTIAGNGTASYCGNNASASSACINSPWGIAIDRKGNIYIGDRGNNCIRKVDAFGIITTIAGTGTAGYNGDGIPATTAMLNYCPGIAIDKIGNLYISDVQNFRIRKVDTLGVITTIAGTGVGGYNGDGIPSSTAQIAGTVGIAVDSNNNIYLTDGGNYRIRKIDTFGIISTIAGTGVAGFSGDNGNSILAQINLSNAITIDKGGNIYFEDGSTYCRIRKINTSGIITTIAGVNSLGFSGDGGPATSAQLNGGDGIAVDRLGNIYIADAGNQRIRRIDVSGIINTVVGNGTQGFSGDGGIALSAELYNPLGIAVDSLGYLYIADTWNNRIRKVDNSIGIKENRIGSQLSIYPNPTSNAISLNTENISSYRGSTITIQNILGEIVKKIPFSKNISVSDLAEGCYFLQITLQKGETYKAKFIKQ